MVPSLDWLIYAFVRKQAVLSSQIEGTQATRVDLLTFEAQEGAEPSAPPNANVEDVCTDLDALTYSRAELAELADPSGLPLSMRLLKRNYQEAPWLIDFLDPESEELFWRGWRSSFARRRPVAVRRSHSEGRGLKVEEEERSVSPGRAGFAPAGRQIEVS